MKMLVSTISKIWGIMIKKVPKVTVPPPPPSTKDYVFIVIPGFKDKGEKEKRRIEKLPTPLSPEDRKDRK